MSSQQAQVPGAKAARVSVPSSLHSLLRQAMIIPQKWSLSATGTEIAASAGNTAGARRSLRLRGLPPTCVLRWGEYAMPNRFLTTQMHETSSSAACVVHELDDVAFTLLSEPTSSLHDDSHPFV